MTEHSKAFIEAFEKFQAEQDTQPVTICEGGELRHDGGGRFTIRGGVIKTMTYGIYRKLFRRPE